MDSLAKLANNPRVTVRRPGPPNPEGTCVVYWMQRAQRGVDNPALDVAVDAANALSKPAVVFFAPVPFYPHANLRHYRFLGEGIADIAADVRARGVGFVLRRFPEHSLVKFCEEVRPCLVVGDENPLREPRAWREKAAERLRVPLWTGDADVIVPSKLLEKEQYAAHIIRPRLQAQWAEFLVPLSNAKAKFAWKQPTGMASLADESIHADFDITEGWELDRSVAPVSEYRGGFRGGSREAARLLKEFVTTKLKGYGTQRNKPENDSTARLSPYLHFGHIGPHTVALAVKKVDVPAPDREAFLNQLLIWRELAVNLVHFNPVYDSIECAEPWAHRTLSAHAKDPRPVIYSEKQLESAETHDPLWNASQMQMVKTGWMHNYVRMYWAKKILEWVKSPAEAYQIAVRLNDKYELDGRDPNGYAGIAWAMAGKYDRPWFEREIFGQIRYMSLASTGKKFDSKKYIAQQLGGGLFD
jgi:deoxyribodipyrimidine photo-lyase